MHLKRKEFNVDKKSKQFYTILLLIIFIPLMFYSVNNLIKSSRQLKTYEVVPKITSTDALDSNEIIQSIGYRNDKRDFNLAILSLLLLFGFFGYFVYLIFIKNIKLVINHNSIQIYSLNKAEASKEILWSDIKSIQFGFMYVKSSRVDMYRMKIVHKKNKEDNRSWCNTFIDVRKFVNDQEIIQIIESIGATKDIDVFHLNE